MGGTAEMRAMDKNPPDEERVSRLAPMRQSLIQQADIRLATQVALIRKPFLRMG